MTPEAQKLLEEVRKLSDDDQSELVNALFGDDEMDPAFGEELDRRAAEIDSGAVKLLTREEFRQKLRDARRG